MAVKSPKSASKPTPKKKDAVKDETLDLLLPEIQKFFRETLGFSAFTPVQVSLSAFYSY